MLLPYRAALSIRSAAELNQSCPLAEAIIIHTGHLRSGFGRGVAASGGRRDVHRVPSGCILFVLEAR